MKTILFGAVLAFVGTSASAQDATVQAPFGTVTPTTIPPSSVGQPVYVPPVYVPPVISVPVPASPIYTPSVPAYAPPVFVPAAAKVPATASLYRSVFAAMKSGNWSTAAALLDGMRDGPLHAVARAELYLAKGSPRVEAGPLLSLIETAPDLPQAAQLVALARARGLQYLPTLPVEQRLVGLSPSPRRERAKAIAGDPVSDAMRTLAEPFVENDQPGALEALLSEREAFLTPDARTEWQQRTAWIYYVVGNYDGARRLAERARLGFGDWAVQGDWVLGLTAWRQADCSTAADAFGRVASRSRDADFIAAGHYWAARADLVCKRPERVQARMRSAARLSETFYGLLAGASLNLAKPVRADGATAAATLATRPNVRAATMLAEIGETGLADTLIRHQARIGGRLDHPGLLGVAAKLNLASTQYWLAHNGPSGTYVRVGDRYPAPSWNPRRGWRVDKALVFAHTLQESAFRTAVVSPAGATGLMQVRPGTAGDIARARGELFSADRLREPAENIEYGQTYLEQLRDRSATGGLLPKVIAAYNAGPVPVEKWNLSVRDGGDPLLYIESLPYWETRGYVPTILRNYWIYQAEAGEASPSLVALAQGKWPRFPTVSQRVASRDDESQVVVPVR